MNKFNDRGRLRSAPFQSGPGPITPAPQPTQPDAVAEKKPEVRSDRNSGVSAAATAGFIVVWQFEIAEHNVTAFEAAYGPNGAWAQLFRSSPDYRGTELLRDAYVPFTYLTIDRWASEDAFRAFRRDHDADYEKLDRACDALTSRETRIGAYTV
jgi:heme-degrading monooxygenase HmoA